MKNKLSAVRKAGGGTMTVLLAGCMLTVLCFNPWTALAVTDGATPTADVQDNISVASLEDASRWGGDLKKAGWGGQGEVPAQTSYKEEGTTVTIYDAEGLAYFAYKVANDESVKEYTVNLESDIDLNNHLWIPIGFSARTDEQNSHPMFSGVFNGNNHTIYNLSTEKFADGLVLNETNHDEKGWVNVSYKDVSIPVPTTDEHKDDEQDGYYNHEYTYGLFGVIGNATVNDLTVASVNVSLAEISIYGVSDSTAHNIIAVSTGALVGYAVGNVKFDGCTAGSTEGILNSSEDEDTEQVIPDLIEGAISVGGLVGLANAKLEVGGSYGTVEFENCKSYINVGGVSDVDIKAGILGYAENTASLKFTNCENYGNIYGDYAGGITSYWQIDEEGSTSDSVYSWEFKDCKNYGNIKGTVNVGGIVGSGGATQVKDGATYSVKISGCKNYGTVTNIADPTVISDGEGATGGIIGYLSVWAESGSSERVLTENFNYGRVEGIQEEPTSSTTASTGGLIGYLNLNGNIVGISGGNYGKITGYSIENGCIGGCASGCDYSSYEYLINAYAVSKGAKQ